MEIKFIPFKPNNDGRLLEPIPTIRSLPSWYKEKSPYQNGEKTASIAPNLKKTTTIKWCNPFGDAYASGYFILLENDVQVTRENGLQNFAWLQGGENFIGQHSPNQISDELIPEGYSKTPWKFANFWGVQTPAGYSTLFTHPLNRPEFPFLTLSGIVDTDSYHVPVNFPFLIREEFEGILEAGTPIAQLIPFRRDSWKMNVEEYNPQKAMAIEHKFNRKIHRAYKMGYWKKKDYK